MPQATLNTQRLLDCMWRRAIRHSYNQLIQWLIEIHTRNNEASPNRVSGVLNQKP